jgi:hypothetical protein
MTNPTDGKSDEDVQNDPHVASSRAGKHGVDDEDGSYVGASGSDDAIDVGETGAEARAEREGQ